jgi:putative hydrolase of HD superfamily
MTNIDSLMKALKIKDEKRTGWELRNIEEPESVAGHSWGTAFLTLVYSEEENVDLAKALKIAVIHDLGEAEIGDIPHRAVDAEPEIDSEEKNRLEREIIEELSSDIGKDILELWEEYEKRKSQEAKFVKDMDLIDMCLQALKYEKQGRYDPDEENENFQKYDNLDEFFATAEPRLTTDTGKHLFQQIKEKYEKEKKDR